MPAIEVNGVGKTFEIPHDRQTSLKERFLHPLHRTTYEKNEAVKDVTFSVDHGECFGVIGPNGSGKSTLLKTIAGIHLPDRGSVVVDGLMSPFIELGVGFNPELNARDNVRVNATMLGLSRRELADKFDEMIEFAELGRFVDLKLKNFSSGMVMRLAYSVAIQVPFDILLLDEVLAVGDQSFQDKCFATLDDIRAAGKTILFVSHDLGSVRRICDRALAHPQRRRPGVRAGRRGRRLVRRPRRPCLRRASIVIGYVHTPSGIGEIARLLIASARAGRHPAHGHPRRVSTAPPPARVDASALRHEHRLRQPADASRAGRDDGPGTVQGPAHDRLLVVGGRSAAAGDGVGVVPRRRDLGRQRARPRRRSSRACRSRCTSSPFRSSGRGSSRSAGPSSGFRTAASRSSSRSTSGASSSGRTRSG